MAPRSSNGSNFKRPGRRRSLGQRVIICCEGEKTEYGYFEDIRKSQHMEPNKIIVLSPAGTDPLTIVQEALAERMERQRNGNWTAEDQAWAVFDGDEHVANSPANWHRALKLAKDNAIYLALTNPSFEYWYLLHFQDQFANLSRQEAKRKLSIHLPGYEKADVLYQTELIARTEAAIQRAQQVAERAERNGVTLYENPCAHVWRLVDLLLSLRKEIQ